MQSVWAWTVLALARARGLNREHELISELGRSLEKLNTSLSGTHGAVVLSEEMRIIVAEALPEAEQYITSPSEGRAKTEVQILDFAITEEKYPLLVDPRWPLRDARLIEAANGVLHARLLELDGHKHLAKSLLLTVNLDNSLKIIDHRSGRILSSTKLQGEATAVGMMMVYSSTEEKAVTLVTDHEEKVYIYDVRVETQGGVQPEVSCELRGAWSLSEAIQEKVDTEGQCYVDTDDVKPCLVNFPRRHRVTAATFTARDRSVSFYVFGTSSGHIAVFTKNGEFQGRILVTRSAGGVVDLGQGGAYGSQPWWLSRKEFGHFSVPTLNSMSRAPCGGWAGNASSIFVERYGARTAFVSLTNGEGWVFATQHRSHRHTSKTCELLYKLPRLPLPDGQYTNRVIVSGSLALIGAVRRPFVDYLPRSNIHLKNSLYLVNLAELEAGSYSTAIGYRVDLSKGAPLAFIDFFVHNSQPSFQRTANPPQNSRWVPETRVGILDATVGFITEDNVVALADLSVEEPYRRPQNRADQGWWVAALSKMLFTLIGVGGVVMYQFRKRNKYGAGRTDSLEEIDECTLRDIIERARGLRDEG